MQADCTTEPYRTVLLLELHMHLKAARIWKLRMKKKQGETGYSQALKEKGVEGYNCLRYQADLL
jgi:hypothetical protein